MLPKVINGSTVIPEDLITQVIQDPRWYYDMPFGDFSNLLKFYMGLTNSIEVEASDNKIKITSATHSEILGQEEIDELIRKMK
jgi:hypothetical protein